MNFERLASNLQEEEKMLESQILPYCNPQQIAHKIMSNLEKGVPLKESWTTPAGNQGEVGSLWTQYELWYIRKPTQWDREGLIRGPISNCSNKSRLAQVILNLVRKYIAEDRIKLVLDEYDDQYSSTMYISASISRADVQNVREAFRVTKSNLSKVEKAERKSNTEAKDFLDQGMVFYKARDYGPALQKLETAHSLVESWDTQLRENIHQKIEELKLCAEKLRILKSKKDEILSRLNTAKEKIPTMGTADEYDSLEKEFASIGEDFKLLPDSLGLPAQTVQAHIGECETFRKQCEEKKEQIKAEKEDQRRLEEETRKIIENTIKLAEQGDAEAQYKIGIMYANGQGVSLDSVKANEVIRKAAAQGYKEAKDYLVKAETEAFERKAREEKEIAERKVREEKEAIERIAWQKKEAAERKAREKKKAAEKNINALKKIIRPVIGIIIGVGIGSCIGHFIGIGHSTIIGGVIGLIFGGLIGSGLIFSIFSLIYDYGVVIISIIIGAIIGAIICTIGGTFGGFDTGLSASVGAGIGIVVGTILGFVSDRGCLRFFLSGIIGTIVMSIVGRIIAMASSTGTPTITGAIVGAVISGIIGIILKYFRDK